MLLIAVSNLCFSMLSRRVISRKIKYKVITISRTDDAATAIKNLVWERHVTKVASTVLVATTTSGSAVSMREAISLSRPSIGLVRRVATNGRSNTACCSGGPFLKFSPISASACGKRASI